MGSTERAWFLFKTEKNITAVLAERLAHSTHALAPRHSVSAKFRMEQGIVT